MARASIAWTVATVARVIDEAPMAKTILLDVPDWPGHTAGQHVDIRLTADDGYTTERAYSIATAPEDGAVALTVERIDGGEVSPYLTGKLRPGDALELRGPIGGAFTWHTGEGGPLLLIAEGSGLVPLMAMLRHRAARSSTVDARLLLSTRSPGDVLYREELMGLAAGEGLAVRHTFTLEPPAGRTGSTRTVDEEMLRAIGPPPARRPRIFASGPTGFVGRVAALLERLGHEPAMIRLEDFGPTGA